MPVRTIKTRNKANRGFWESAAANDATFIQYYNRLVELSVAMFEWRNLPDTIDERYLELTLFAHGQAVFFKDEVMGFLCLPCNTLGSLSVYGEPIDVMAYSTGNGYTRPVHINAPYALPVNPMSDGILIHNNMIHTNSMLDVEMFAMRLYNLDRCIDVNANAQKTPVLIKCSNEQRLTLKNVYKQYDGNEPVIWGDKGLDTSGFGVLRTEAPYTADKIYVLKTQYWNEALTYLGISNMNFIKKERLVSDEVMRSQGSTMASRYSRLSQRQDAADKINKLFGLNIKVEYRDDINPIMTVGVNELNGDGGGN